MVNPVLMPARKLAATDIHPKVAAAGVAGAATVIVLWIASLLGLDIPPEVASAIPVVIAVAAGYLRSSGTAP